MLAKDEEHPQNLLPGIWLLLSHPRFGGVSELLRLLLTRAQRGPWAHGSPCSAGGNLAADSPAA